MPLLPSKKWENTEWWPFTEAAIKEHGPNWAGVYAIGGGETWIYIGEGKDIQDRLLQHVSGQSDQSGCIFASSPDKFSYELWDEEGARLRREAALIELYDPICNFK